MPTGQEAGQAVAGRIKPRWVVLWRLLERERDGVDVCLVLARDSYKDKEYRLMPQLNAKEGHIPVFPTKEDAESFAVLWTLGADDFTGELHAEPWNG